MNRFYLTNKGFTLIELLVVIAVIGTLAGALVVLINPASIFDKARIAQGKSFQGNLTRTLGFYTVGAWNFNDQSNPTIDTSGYGATSVISGATYVPECDFGYGGCYSFDGNDKIDVNSNALAISNSLTIAAWIKPTSGGSTQNIVSNSNPWDYRLYKNGTTLTMQVSLDNNNTGYHSAVGVLTSGDWQQVTAVFDGITVKLYVNGRQVLNQAASGSIQSPGSSIVIGSYGSGEYFNGLIDEVYVFNQALSQAMIEKYYTRGVLKHYLASNNL